MLLRLLLLLCNTETPPPPLQVSAEETKYECRTSILFASAECEFTQHNATQQISFYSSFVASTTPCCVYFMCSCVRGVDQAESFLTATQFISSILKGETGYVRTASNRQGCMSVESNWSGKTHQMRNVSNASSPQHRDVSMYSRFVCCFAITAHTSERWSGSGVSNIWSWMHHRNVKPLDSIPWIQFQLATKKNQQKNYTTLHFSLWIADTPTQAHTRSTVWLTTSLDSDVCRQNECIQNAFDRLCLCQKSFFGYPHKFTWNYTTHDSKFESTPARQHK